VLHHRFFRATGLWWQNQLAIDDGKVVFDHTESKVFKIVEHNSSGWLLYSTSLLLPTLLLNLCVYSPPPSPPANSIITTLTQAKPGALFFWPMP
jgi:hypothetical protein